MPSDCELPSNFQGSNDSLSFQDYQGLFNQIPSIFFLLDCQGIILETGEFTARRLGYHRVDLCGRPLADLIDESHWVSHQAQLGHVLNSQFPSVGDYPVRCQDGSLLWVKAIAHSLRLAHHPAQVILLWEDITPHAIAPDHNHYSQQPLQALFHRALDAMVIVNDAGQLLEVNLTACKLFGLASSELVGRAMADFGVGHFPLPDLPRFPETSTSHLSESYVRRADGSSCFVEYTTTFHFLPHRHLVILRDITLHRLMEEALRFSEARYRTIVEDQTGLISRFLPDGTVLFLNQAYSCHLGQSARDLVGENLFKLLPETAGEQLRQRLQSLSLSQPVVSSSQIVTTAHGETRYYQWSDRALFNEQGEILEYQSVGQDITPIKKVQDELLQQQHFIQEIANTAPDILYIYDLEEQRNIYSNRQITTVLGYSPEDIQAMGENFLRTLVHPEDWPSIVEAQQKLPTLQDGEIGEVEYRIQDAQGNWHWMHSRDVAFSRTPEGKVKQVLGTALDVTERRQAKAEVERYRLQLENLVQERTEELLQANSHLSVIAANLPGAVFRCICHRDPQFDLAEHHTLTIPYISAGVEPLTGWNPDHWMENPQLGWQLLHPDDRLPFLQTVHQALDQARSFEAKLRILAGGETKWLRMVVRSHDLPNGDLCFDGLVLDVTRETLAEEALRQQAQRQQLLNQIASQIRRTLNLSDILNSTTQLVRDFLNCDRLLIYRNQGQQQGQVVAESVQPGWDSTLQVNSNPGWRLPPEQTLPEIQVIHNVDSDPLTPTQLQLLQEWQVQACLVVPILHHPLENDDNALKEEPVWGLLMAQECGQIRVWQPLEIECLSQLAVQLAIAIQQAELYQQLQLANLELSRLATLDGLTELANRRYFDYYLQQEWQHLAQTQHPLALILSDIDFFKRYNDSYGHQAGDECLKQVAQTIRRSLKSPADLVARYGGEEFAVILPNTSLAEAIQVAETIRQAINRCQIPHQASDCTSHVTLSLGVSCMIPQMNLDPEQLVAAADQALYRAKQQGRDRTISSETSCPLIPSD